MENLVGKKFNKLTVEEFDHKEVKMGKSKKIYYYYWKCKCDCGKETIVKSADLKSGNIKSCGCLGKETQKKLLNKNRQERFKELSKKKYGRLTIIAFDHIEVKIGKENKKYYYRYWKCKCDCGNEVSVIEGNLLRGTTRSCGCLEKELISKRTEKNFTDITGNKYGKLTAISMFRKKDSKGINREYWKCKCDCGKETVVKGVALKSGNVKSCGCEITRAGKEYAKKGQEVLERDLRKEGTDLSKLSNIPTKQNRSGVRGVSFLSKKNKYKAYIYFKGKYIELGTFDTLEKASVARRKAEDKYFKPILEKYNYTPKNKKLEENEEEFE